MTKAAAAHRLILNEFLKLHTTRSPFVLIGVAQLVVVGGISGVFLMGRDPNLVETVRLGFSHVGIVAIFSLMLGITAVAGEYRHKTITDTYLATPQRGRVVGAKVVTYMVVGAGVGVLSAVTALATLAIWMSAKDATLDLAASGVWQTIAGCIVWNICFGAVGVGVGALVRNLSGAIAGALVWIALVEGIVGQLVGDAARWLPFRAGGAMEGLPSPGVAQLSQVAGGLVLGAYAAAFVAVAVTTTIRRDVT
jgi:ABC-2 type transport system permease protein